jgi:hypothetical protein
MKWVPLVTCTLACASAAHAPISIPPTTTAASSPSPDAARARELVFASAAWTRVTLEAYEKSTLCFPRGHAVGDAPKSTHRTGELFHTFVSPDAAEAYRSRVTLPIGAAISKKTFDPVSGATRFYFLMWKESAGTWTYATAQPDGSVIRAGALQDCAGCHDKQRAEDFLFRKM